MTARRTITAADAAGCALAGVLALTPAASCVAGSASVRRRLSAALAATSLVLGRSLRHGGPDGRDMALAAAVNGCWVGGCLASARRMSPGPGRNLVLATAGLDAVAGVLQAVLVREAGHGPLPRSLSGAR